MTTTTISNGVNDPSPTIASGNGVDVLAGGSVTSATVQAGSVATNSAGSATTPAAGLIIETGGIDMGSIIQVGATELVLGAASGDNVFGLQYVSAATATVSNEIIHGGGVVDLYLKGVVATGLDLVGGGVVYISGNAVATNTTLSGGTLVFQSPKATISGSLILQGNANTFDITASQSPGSAGIADQAVISGFALGDVIDDTAVMSGATVLATSATAGAVETVTITSGGTAVETLMFTAGTVAVLKADMNGFVELVACYCPGTRIRTDAGEVAVEDLRVGARVLTVDGALEPVRWIGRRSYTGRTLAGRRHLAPIRIKAGALAEATPTRDLLISPLHAMLIDGVLVPAHHLVNGTTVVREESLTEIHYVHIELDRHEAIWAEGAASETFVDDNGRFIFQTSDGEPVSQPDAPVYCAPRVDDGYALEAIRLRLAKRAELLTEAV